MARDCANSLLPDLLMPLVTNKPRYRKMYPGFVHSTTTLNPILNRSPSQGVEMHKMPYKSDPNLWSILIAFGMTLVGAIASYSFKVLNGEAFSWRTMCLQLIVSIFAGLLMIMIAIHYGWPQEVTGGVCGMAGWSGSSLIKALEGRFLNKASGVVDEDKQ